MTRAQDGRLGADTPTALSPSGSSQQAVSPADAASITGAWTPGPWRIDPDATFIGDHYVGTDKADIALMANWALDLEPEQWANAHLIAAAPDLFEALAEYMACVAFASNPSLANADVLTLKGASDRMKAARDASEAALNKALGK